MGTRTFRVVMGLAMLVSSLLFTGCIPIFKHFTEDKIVAHRTSSTSEEEIGVRESGWANRLLYSWEPNYWSYSVKDRQYFYVTNGTRLDLPFLVQKDTHPAFITPMNNGNWFALYFGKQYAACIFNETGVLHYKPFDFSEFPLEPNAPKIRFTDSPPQIEAWFFGHRFAHESTFEVYIFDSDLNLKERRHNVTEPAP